MTIGLSAVISDCPSRCAPRIAEPRKACPSTPSSVLSASSPSWLLPENRPVRRPYVVTGVSSQPNSVSVTSTIFIGPPCSCQSVGISPGEPGSSLAGCLGIDGCQPFVLGCRQEPLIRGHEGHGLAQGGLQSKRRRQVYRVEATQSVPLDQDSSRVEVLGV